MTAAIEMPLRRRYALTVVVMAATLVQVLDATVANVALPHMQAALGAAPDTVSWVLTSYIVAAAVATPTTGWLETRIGRHRLIAIAVAGFTVSSVVCGFATSLQMMVLARVAQGSFGAFITPLSQAIMLDIYPEKDRAKAMTIWGMGVMIGPILGPVVGGILTDTYNWRWVFFVNVPIGVLALAGLLILMPRIKAPSVPFDAIGFAMLALGLGSFQLLLDRGTQLDWFSSAEIVIELGLAISMLWMFAVHTMTARSPLIRVDIFRDRNFVLANLFLLVVMGVLMSTAALLPPMLQSLFGYNAIDAGMLVMPRGVAMMISMYVVGRVVGKIDDRILVATGMLIIGGSQWMMTDFSLEMDSRPVIVTGLLQGFGFGFVMIPLNLAAFATIPSSARTSAAAVWSLSRNIGGSIAISLFAALFAYNVQVSHSDLTSHFSSVRFPLLRAGIIERAGVSSDGVLQLIDAEINRQAAMIAYLDDFWLMSILTLLLLPLTLLLRVRKGQPAKPETMVME